MSSSDGFCSTLSFAPGELGQIYTGPTGPANAANAVTSSIATPLPTPTQISPSPVKSSHGPASSAGPTSSAPHGPPASPARSNSASSVVTQSSNQQGVGVVNNPTPTLGSVPLVTAAHSAQPSALPLTTPPQTPISTSSHCGTNTTVSVLGKRDARTTSESEKEESKGPETTGQQPKKRRIAPTLISASTDMPPSKDGNAGAST